MLTDLLLLETYFEEPFGVALYEDLAAHYGEDAIKEALSFGFLEMRTLLPLCATDSSARLVCRLTETGRVAACSNNRFPSIRAAQELVTS